MEPIFERDMPEVESWNIGVGDYDEDAEEQAQIEENYQHKYDNNV